MAQAKKISCVVYLVCLVIVGIVGDKVSKATQHLPPPPPSGKESIDLLQLEFHPAEYWETVKKKIEEKTAIDAVQESLHQDTYFLIPAYTVLFLSLGLYLFFSQGLGQICGIAVILLAIAGAACDYQENRLLATFVTNPNVDLHIVPWTYAKWVLLFLATSAAAPWFLSRTDWTKWVGGILALTGLAGLGVLYHWKFFFPASTLFVCGLLLIGVSFVAKAFYERLITIIKWMFVYLPQNFSIPLFFIGYLFLFVWWPWTMEWIDRIELGKFLNLHRSIQTLLNSVVLTIGVFATYNIAAVYYQVTSGLSNGSILSCLRKKKRWRRWLPIVSPILVFLQHYWLLSVLSLLVIVGFWFPCLFSPACHRPGLWPLVPLTIPIGFTLLGAVIYRKYYDPDDRPATSNEDGEDWPSENKDFTNWKETTRDCAPKIGIILAGGGAKGVYQAGALKAIHEFLKHYEVLENVRMIAGTSIGSWNSLFWLADLIHAEPGEQSEHEKWWSTVDIRKVISFDWYVPFLHNSFLLTDPWEEEFGRIFQKKKVALKLKELWAGGQTRPTHFYLTNTNVNKARLEFTTNCVDPEIRKQIEEHFGGGPKSQQLPFVEVVKGQRPLTALKAGVFTSMNLPPLFGYYQDKKSEDYIEDGGVIDNLPTIFGTEIEECDLLFVLPLNASFDADPKTNSILKRMARVMDMRQGALERDSLKLIRRFNNEHKDKPVTVVAICPDQPLTITTGTFWQTNEFGPAFKLTYRATKEILKSFKFFANPTEPKDLMVYLVEPKENRQRGRANNVEIMNFKGEIIKEEKI